MAAQKAASKNNVTAQDIAAPKTTIQEARERPVTAESQEEVWPPMSEMLHSLLIFEPAVQRPGRSEFDEENRETDGKTSEREVLPPAPVPVVVLGIKSGREELSETQRRLLTNADLLCAGRALLERFVPEAGKKNPPETLLLAAPLEPVYTRIAEARAAGLRVLVLADGDPLFFGIGASLTRLMGRRAVHVIPAVSSLQLACSRLGLPWHDVICLSLHGRNNFGPLNSAISRGAPICLLTDGDIRPDEVARHLLDRGVDWFSAHVFERLDFPDETATHAPLTKAAGMEFGPSCTLVLVPSGPGRMPHLGLRGKDLAAENGIVTKMPVRAAALALLRIAPTHTVWDIGSGSGAMAIEAAVLAHQGRVAAVEKKPERVLCIEENRRRFGAAQVDIYLGEAPSCLEVLPDPQRIFIGGGLSADNGLRTLDHVSRRLPPGGRVVTSCALLNTLSRCRDFFSGQGWPHEIVCVQAAKTRPLADDAHFVAMNPIFVLAAQKPEETP
ncbi:MAG: precorrin-6y C5,15-methyltransferase (decarboxylating) subunit CbiE [Desulfovibrio sp.]|nr:precorrin-6y C5,15-methyltransferase (decarboxylating) subunit CbiE [Desulfovibrio sp.]